MIILNVKININLYLKLLNKKFLKINNIKIQHLSQNFKEILNLLFKILKY